MFMQFNFLFTITCSAKEASFLFNYVILINKVLERDDTDLGQFIYIRK